jgi:hypothetical protein
MKLPLDFRYFGSKLVLACWSTPPNPKHGLKVSSRSEIAKLQIALWIQFKLRISRLCCMSHLKSRIEFPFFRQQMAQREFLSDIAKQNVGWGFRAEAVRLRGESRDEVSLLWFTSLGLACIFEGVLEVEAVLGGFMR